MNSILPLKYVFNSKNVLTPNRTHIGPVTNFVKDHYATIILSVLALIVIIFLALMVLNRTVLTVIMFIMSFIYLSSVFINNYDSYESDCEFALTANSNLIVKPDENNHPHYENETKGYPYRIYIKDPEKYHKLLYLGRMKGKHLYLANKNAANQLFINYYYYAQKQHLTDKFKNKIYFVKDPKTTNNNGVPQYVLKGDGITLKTRMPKQQKEQVYAVKD